MALSDLVTAPAPISDEDRLAQTTRLIERTFGQPVTDLGDLSMLDGEPTLTFEHNGTHALTWERDRNSAILFKVDGVMVPGLGGEGSPQRLIRWLDTK